MTYGFILTRRVISTETNKYWNQCVKLIRTHYPDKQIVIIDDNSDISFLSADFDYKNLTVIKSEYPGRGELLPYIYYLKHRWFDSAVIMHDSTFINKKISFGKIKDPVVPLWHHKYDKENLPALYLMAKTLNNNANLIKILCGDDSDLLSFRNKYNLCFGCQAYISLNFLDGLEQKYKISNLLNVVKTRVDRCCLERILGIIFCEEYQNLLQSKSIFGDIFNHTKSLNYTFNEYMNDFKNNRLTDFFVKVWTGR